MVFANQLSDYQLFKATLFQWMLCHSVQYRWVKLSRAFDRDGCLCSDVNDIELIKILYKIYSLQQTDLFLYDNNIHT
jgi:hypothetical protein